MAAHRQWSVSRPISVERKRSHNDAEGEELGVEYEADARVLDRLCLALGLVTNLVQALDDANDLIRKTREHSQETRSIPLNALITSSFSFTGINPLCTGKRMCIQACQCQRRISALDCIAQLYIQQAKANADLNDIDPGADFLRGHLAVLLGLLMRNNKANQKVLLAASLPGSSQHAKLAALADQAREFVTFYAELALKLSKAARGRSDDGDEGSDDGDGDGGDDGPSLENYNVDRIARDRNNGQVAQEVISFLETLAAQHQGQ